MAGEFYTPFQKRKIDGYYANLDAATMQKLQEAASDLYLATDEKAKVRLWKVVTQALAKTAVPPAKAQQIVTNQDIKALATLVGELAGLKQVVKGKEKGTGGRGQGAGE